MRNCAAAARAALAIVVAALLIAAPAAQPRSDHWVAGWTTATVGRPQTPPAPTTPGAPTPAAYVHFADQTLRQIVHTSAGGGRVRAVFSNVFGSAPLTIGAAHVALRDKESAIIPASDRALTFSGRTSVAIPAHAVMLSDAVTLSVPAAADLAVDLYLPGTTMTMSPLTMHMAAHQTSYVSEAGNHVGAAAFPVAARTPSWFALARVELTVPAAMGTIVAFGDSITDGTASTTDANGRWPDVLSRRLASQKLSFAVANAGIGGNRLLSEGTVQAGINALARFDRDALDVPGVTHVIVLEGINDIGNARDEAPPSADDLIAAHTQLIERAHLRGVRMIGATLTPFEGANYFTAAGEAKRQALNTWISTSRVYDGVVDFDAATRDPAQPQRFLAAYDSGDHLHPNDAGYKAMGEAIDLAIFRRGNSIASLR